MKRTTFVLLAATLLAACDSGQPADPYADAPLWPPNSFLTEAHDGASMPIRTGVAFEVRLHGNETIDPPVAWSVASVPAILRLSSQRVVLDDPEADGAGATWIFRFITQQEGRGRLVFDGGASGRRVSIEVISDPTVIND